MQSRVHLLTSTMTRAVELVSGVVRTDADMGREGAPFESGGKQS